MDKIPPLRAQVSAAPLKPGVLAHSTTAWHAPPRSSERGPVEAGLRKLIKPPVADPPRSSERGPVEALGVVKPTSRVMSLRAQVSAAPLKRQ